MFGVVFPPSPGFGSPKPEADSGAVVARGFAERALPAGSWLPEKSISKGERTVTRNRSVAVLAAILLCTVAFGLAQSAAAEAPKPILTVSVAGYDALLSDLGYIGQLGGNPDLPKLAEGFLMDATEGKGLEGLDKERPLGMALFPDPGDPVEEPTILIFVPVTDNDKLLEVVRKLGLETEDGPDGSLELRTPDGDPMNPQLFVKKMGDWAYVTNRLGRLGEMPKDPTTLLGGSEKQYDTKTLPRRCEGRSSSSWNSSFSSWRCRFWTSQYRSWTR
jgi:hypothetical protein